MPDNVTAQDRGSGQKRAIPPEMQARAVLADVIDLGERKEQYAGEDPHLVHKIVLVFQTDERSPETGRRYEVHREFTNSMGKKSNLRKFLSDWRGKSYSQDEARRGVALASQVGVNGLISIEHKTKRDASGVYPVIATIAPLPKMISAIKVEDYQRAPFWEDRKQEYEQSASELRAKDATRDSFETAPAALKDGDDDLPF